MPATKTIYRYTPVRLTAKSCVLTGDLCPDADTVLIDSDVFVVRDGPIVDGAGNTMRLRQGKGMPLDERVLSDNHFTRQWGAESFPLLKLADLRQSIFDTIDARPKQRFIVPTRHPERVWQTWPNDPCVDLSGRDNGTAKIPRANLILAVPVDSQRQLDADTMLPELAKLRELCGGLGVVYSGREEVDWWEDCDLDSPEGLGVDFTLILDPAEVDAEYLNVAGFLYHKRDDKLLRAIEAEEQRIADNIASARSVAEAAGIEILESKGR